jgi:hypothetical protein
MSDYLISNTEEREKEYHRVMNLPWYAREIEYKIYKERVLKLFNESVEVKEVKF